MKATALPKIEWVAHERIITLRKAHKQYECAKCRQPIDEGSAYYSLVVTGSGVSGMKGADRVHIRCLGRKYSERG
jgi:hypothetical protein